MKRLLEYDVYIGGAMHFRLGREVLSERAEAKKLLKKAGLTYYDPAEDEDINPDEMIDGKPSLPVMRGFVKKDDDHIDQSFAYLNLTGDRASSGALWEMARMYYKHKPCCGGPIVLVAPKMAAGALRNFTTVKATAICATLPEAIKTIKRYLK